MAEDWRLEAEHRLRWEGSRGGGLWGRLVGAWLSLERVSLQPFRRVTPSLGLRGPLGEGVKECWATWQARYQPQDLGFCHATMGSGCSIPAHPGPTFRHPLAASDADGA